MEPLIKAVGILMVSLIDHFCVNGLLIEVLKSGLHPEWFSDGGLMDVHSPHKVDQQFQHSN